MTITIMATEEDKNHIHTIDTDVETGHGSANELHSMNRNKVVLYEVDERPPWYLAISFGFQHFLTFIGSGIGIPLLLAGPLCMDQDQLAVSQLISTALFVEGLITLLQVTFGVRLPVVQGGSFAFIVPAFALLNTYGECPVSLTASASEAEMANYTEAWQIRMRKIQGAIIGASLLQVVVGLTGIIGFLLRFIGPVTVAPVVALVGIGVVVPAAARAGQHWGIAALTIVSILIFSQYLRKIELPVPGWKRGKCSIVGKVPIFKMFPIVLGTVLAWFISFVFTVGGILPDNPSTYGYGARTDLKSHVIEEASWFRVPYPGQWGLPEVTVAGVLGMFSAVIASIIESIGDYYATARMAGVPPPPPHAVNRGIAAEGIGCILAGVWGTANGTTTFSQNAGLVGLTRVGSRVVVQICALIMIIVGLLGKVTAIFSSIPLPIVGGMFCILFGTVLAVGLSNLQYVDLNSPRNILIIGFSIFMGMLVPNWVGSNRALIATGNTELDQVIAVLLTTGMFIGGVLAFVLDNTIPGTKKERGLVAFSNEYKEINAEDGTNSMDVYDLPFGMTVLRKWKWTQYIPFSPTFKRKEMALKGDRNIVNEHDDATIENKSSEV